MSDDSFLDRVFGPPPQVAATTAPASPAPPATPAPPHRPRGRAPITPRRYALLVAAMVGLTALPTWIVLRAGVDGLDPDFGARLAGPVQAFSVPGEPRELLPEYPQQRPTRPAPQSDPVTGRPGAPVVIAVGPPREVKGAEPVLERRHTAEPPAPRPVWHPARPAKPAKPTRPTGPVGHPGGHAGPRDCPQRPSGHRPPRHRPAPRPHWPGSRPVGRPGTWLPGGAHAPGAAGGGHHPGRHPSRGQADPIRLPRPARHHSAPRPAQVEPVQVKHVKMKPARVKHTKVKHVQVRRPHVRQVGHGRG